MYKYKTQRDEWIGERVLPELALFDTWKENEILSYTVFTCKYIRHPDSLVQSFKSLMKSVANENGFNDGDSLHYVARVETNGAGENHIHPHIHALIGHHKISSCSFYGKRTWKWYDRLLKNKVNGWTHGIVHNQPYAVSELENKIKGSIFYNLKAKNGRYSSEWDDRLIISNRLLRELKKRNTENAQVSFNPLVFNYL